ncbi:sigma-70 family RNA polymerase sigma factor [Sporolactobacillus sp. CPB3-1]|uniref:Sigma-70 family RNA polymerase sigma factor n=1 Tax=Sporolactobacillus mangiferae TaxID=2940498 RepID=A0ABT0MCD7_9BACL|nr:sigma-70 family RNA polymerase sigma factor [Sporolactobacillus mangiferae]MCL1632233.1 sigma-70 family RNA polymerase sigma factor [Sporolactobacillus mangiferae]
MKKQHDQNEAFARSMQPYMSAIRHQCAQLAGNPWDGDDLFQQVMMKCFKAWRANPLRSITKAYLYRIISHAWIDAHRKRRVSESVRESFDDMAAAPKSTDGKLAEAMKIVLNQLTDRQRLVYLMKAGWGLSASEIAEYCGETAGNVRVLYFRAKKRLASRQETLLSDPDEIVLADYMAAFLSGEPERLLSLRHLKAPVRQRSFRHSDLTCMHAA